MSGKLYLVATPIGNLDDITIRAINTLKEVDLIVAEDTRQTLKFLNHFNIKKALVSYHRHNEEIKVENLINKLIEGKNLAVVSDAGTPAISDPGEVIVREAIKNDIKIIPIPGACALINGLIASGLDTKEFCFFGFLPVNKKLRKEKMDEIKKENKTIILYEAPHKILNTLNELNRVLENRKIVLARELTKIHEEFIRGSLNDISEKYEEPKGEHIIIIEGNAEDNKKEKELIEFMKVEDLYDYYKKQNLPKNEIIKKIAKDKKVAKNEIYKLFINK